MIVRIHVLDLIIIIKSEEWPIWHCLVLGHETMACLSIDLCLYLISGVCLRLGQFTQLSFMQYMEQCVFTCIHFSYDDCENTCTWSYHHHHQIGRMTHMPLFSVGSWNNGMRSTAFYRLMCHRPDKGILLSWKKYISMPKKYKKVIMIQDDRTGWLLPNHNVHFTCMNIWRYQFHSSCQCARKLTKFFNLLWAVAGFTQTTQLKMRSLTQLKIDWLNSPDHVSCTLQAVGEEYFVIWT